MFSSFTQKHASFAAEPIQSLTSPFCSFHTQTSHGCFRANGFGERASRHESSLQPNQKSFCFARLLGMRLLREPQVVAAIDHVFLRATWCRRGCWCLHPCLTARLAFVLGVVAGRSPQSHRETGNLDTYCDNLKAPSVQVTCIPLPTSQSPIPPSPPACQ